MPHHSLQHVTAHVMIWDMAIDRGFSSLAVFTRGRGAWVWSLPSGLTDLIFKDDLEMS